MIALQVFPQPHLSSIPKRVVVGVFFLPSSTYRRSTHGMEADGRAYMKSTVILLLLARTGREKKENERRDTQNGRKLFWRQFHKHSIIISRVATQEFVLGLEVREVELGKNERFVGFVLFFRYFLFSIIIGLLRPYRQSTSPTSQNTSIPASAPSPTAYSLSCLPPRKGWSKQSLKNGERIPCTKGRDGWSHVDGSNTSVTCEHS